MLKNKNYSKDNWSKVEISIENCLEVEIPGEKCLKKSGQK